MCAATMKNDGSAHYILYLLHNMCPSCRVWRIPSREKLAAITASDAARFCLIAPGFSVKSFGESGIGLDGRWTT